MKFTMTKPCDLCPFVRGGLGLSKERALALGGQIVDGRGRGGNSTFVCHKTGRSTEDGEIVAKPDSQHCAGALIFAEKQDAPTQMMRIAERIGSYDRRKLDMTANVFDDLGEMIAASEPERKRARR